MKYDLATGEAFEFDLEDFGLKHGQRLQIPAKLSHVSGYPGGAAPHIVAFIDIGLGYEDVFLTPRQARRYLKGRENERTHKEKEAIRRKENKARRKKAAKEASA